MSPKDTRLLPAFGKQPNRQVRGLKFEDVTGTTMSEKLDKTGFVGGLYKIIEYSGNGCRSSEAGRACPRPWISRNLVV